MSRFSEWSPYDSHVPPMGLMGLGEPKKMSKINIKCVTVGSGSMRQGKMREEIEREVQKRADQGWTLRAMGSRGGAMYLVFAEKVKG